LAKPEGRILSLDVGERRIGIALTDELHFTVRGLPTLVRKNRKTDFKTLSSVIRDHEVKLVVLGNPIHISGEKSDQSRKVERFAERLRKHSDVKTELWDERLTSVEAEEMIGGRRLRGEERKQAIDQAAAMLILESYLRNRPTSSP
jgi:putative Holliday junction resolvase